MLKKRQIPRKDGDCICDVFVGAGRDFSRWCLVCGGNRPADGIISPEDKPMGQLADINRNATRLEALEMFYERALSDTNLLDLMYVNAVAEARVVCRDALKILDINGVCDAGGEDGRLEILNNLYETITEELYDPDKTFLETAPFIRREVARTTKSLSEYEACKFHDLSKCIQTAKSVDAAKLITVVNVRAGDILVVAPEEHFGAAGLERIEEDIMRILPSGVKVLMSESALSFSVIRPAPEPRDEHG